MLICEKRSFNHAEKDICVLFVQDYQNTPMISQTCENFLVNPEVGNWCQRSVTRLLSQQKPISVFIIAVTFSSG